MNNFVLALLAPAAFLITAMAQGKQLELRDLVFAVGVYFMALGFYYAFDRLAR